MYIGKWIKLMPNQKYNYKNIPEPGLSHPGHFALFNFVFSFVLWVEKSETEHIYSSLEHTNRQLSVWVKTIIERGNATESSVPQSVNLTNDSSGLGIIGQLEALKLTF